MLFRAFTLFIILSSCVTSEEALAQSRKRKEKIVEPVGDLFTLRYKPQVGTLYYDVNTAIEHNLEGRHIFPIRSTAQLALDTKGVDQRNLNWTYDYFYRELKTILSKHQLPNGSGEDSVLNEVRAIGKRTRVTYSMLGRQVRMVPIDTARLSGEAQFFSYFFQPPRLLAPLPEKKVSYGATWEDNRVDTVTFVDTLGIEQFTRGMSVYRLKYTYKFERLQDSVDGSVAVISSVQSGSFSGMQYNPSGDRLDYTAPITGTDTTYLDLLTGRVIYRDTHYDIPVLVTAPGRPSTSDKLDIRTIVMLNIDNIRTTATPNGKAR